MKKLNITTYIAGFIPLLVVSFISVSLPTPVSAEETCIFTKDLEDGSTSEEVRCLQKFLNTNGYLISDSGPGSPGSETTLFREKTREALKKWQEAMKIWPVSGYFGPVSRSVYRSTQKRLQSLL